MYYVYLLKLSNNKYYAGFSKDLKTRVDAHMKGKIISTKKRLPITLVFYAAFSSQKKATDFEKYLKSSSGFAFRNKRLV